jgi:hypothetical protein
MPIADLPQSNKQHAVPQNIMDVEFKLIGDLTMRQFSYLLLGGILSYLSFVAVVGIFKVPLGLVFALLGLALAFVPLGERGLDDWIVSFIKAINSPTQRVWKKEPEIPIAFSYQSVDVLKQEMITLAPTSSRRKLEEYLKYQVEGEKADPLDIPEQEYIMKVREAFSDTGGYSNQPSVVSPSVGVSVIEEEPKLEELPKTFESRPEEEKQKSEESNVSDVSKAETKITESKDVLIKAKEVVPGTITEKGGISITTPIIARVGEKPKIVDSRSTMTSSIQKRVRLLQEGDLTVRKDSIAGFSTMTPDMHSGRRFTNLLPSNGELILPIRGERTLRTSDQAVEAEDLKEKTEKLQQLLTNIRKQEGVKMPQPPIKENVVIPTPVVPQETKIEPPVKNIQQPNIGTPGLVNTTDTMNKDFVDERQRQMEGHVAKISSEYSELEKRYQQLQAETKEKRKEGPDSGAAAFYSTAPIPKPPLTQTRDVLTGIVKGAGDQLLADVLIIVKNKNGEAVRAVKTNTMGQFILLTPLDKGFYKVEVSKSNNLTETFDIISVEVKGELVPLLEFIAK